MVIQRQKAEIGLAPRDQEVIDCYSSSVLEGERGYPDGDTIVPDSKEWNKILSFFSPPYTMS